MTNKTRIFTALFLALNTIPVFADDTKTQIKEAEQALVVDTQQAINIAIKQGVSPEDVQKTVDEMIQITGINDQFNFTLDESLMLEEPVEEWVPPAVFCDGSLS